MLALFLGTWWNELNGTEQIFWGIAIVFSVLFLIQFVFSLIGLDFDADVDFDSNSPGSSLGGDFTVFSIRGIIAFFTFFGWTGGLILNNGGSTLKAAAGASMSGTAAMMIVGYVMYMFHKLGEVGNVDLSNAIDHNGEVYIPIPEQKHGQGKIHLTLQGALKELDAVTEGSAIPTGTSVKVIKILNNNVLLVEPLKN